MRRPLRYYLEALAWGIGAVLVLWMIIASLVLALMWE